MKSKLWRSRTLLLLVGGILAIFILRTLLAVKYSLPRLDDLFTAIAVTGSLVVLFMGHGSLRRSDWVSAIALGSVVGAGMLNATLFSPYPFWGVVGDNVRQALIRGLFTALAALGGIVVMRQGGPVLSSAANGEWKKLGGSLVLGLVAGAPLALVNLYALQLTQGRTPIWQNPLASMLDALQPGIVEEVVYRFAFLGVLWQALRNSLPEHAAWVSGLLALLVHTFLHFDDLFLQAPLVALGMGVAMAVLWGLPSTILALRRDLESAIAFHWVQDVVRFLAGF